MKYSADNKCPSFSRPLIDRMLALEETRDALQQAVDRRNEELVVRNKSSQQSCRC